MESIKTFPPCRNRGCFAWKGGKCTALENNTFKKPCPFFKDRRDIKMTELNKACKEYAALHKE